MTPPDDAGLVERLRATEVFKRTDPAEPESFLCFIRPEALAQAADRIEALKGEVERLRGAIDTFALDFIMAHDASPPDSHLRLIAFREAVRDLCAARSLSRPVGEE